MKWQRWGWVFFPVSGGPSSNLVCLAEGGFWGQCVFLGLLPDFHVTGTYILLFLIYVQPKSKNYPFKKYMTCPEGMWTLRNYAQVQLLNVSFVNQEHEQAAKTASTLLGGPYHKILEPGCRTLFPFSHENSSEVSYWYWYWMVRPILQLLFQFIWKVS